MTKTKVKVEASYFKTRPTELFLYKFSFNEVTIV